MEPLGKNHALVFVCGGCSEEQIVAQFGPELAYEPTGIKSGEFRDALRKLQGPEAYAAESERNRMEGQRPAPARPLGDVLYQSFAAEGIRRRRVFGGKQLGGKAGTRSTKPSGR